MFKRRTKVSPTFNMASMTDIIFLLLIFFMITSTMVSPNAIKVLLPQGKKQTTVKATARVVIDKDLNLYAAAGNEKEEPVTLEELPKDHLEWIRITTLDYKTGKIALKYQCCVL